MRACDNFPSTRPSAARTRVSRRFSIVFLPFSISCMFERACLWLRWRRRDRAGMDQRVSARAPQVPLKLGYFSHVFKTLRNNEILAAKRFGAGGVCIESHPRNGRPEGRFGTQTDFNELAAPRKD